MPDLADSPPAEQGGRTPKPKRSTARRVFVACLVSAAVVTGIGIGADASHNSGGNPSLTIPTVTQPPATPPAPLTHKAPDMQVSAMTDVYLPTYGNSSVNVNITITNDGSSTIQQPTITLTQDGKTLALGALTGCNPAPGGAVCSDVGVGAQILPTITLSNGSTPAPAGEVNWNPTGGPIQVFVKGNGVAAGQPSAVCAANARGTNQPCDLPLPTTTTTTTTNSTSVRATPTVTAHVNSQGKVTSVTGLDLGG